MTRQTTETATPGTPEYQESVVQYFAEKASQYDRVDEQVYWRLSDELLWEGLLRYVIPSLPDRPHILDAGGGTGRWTERLLRHLPTATCTLVDLSPDMTAIAREKAERGGYADRLAIDVQDLAALREACPEGSVDLAISFHNVLGFVDDPEAVMDTIVSTLRPGGLVCLFAPNVHHGVFFNLSIGADDVACRIAQEGVGSFTSSMPNMRFFTAEGLERTLVDAGVEVEVMTGTPVYVYPGFAETQIEGTSGRLATLADERRYETVLGLEKAVLGQRSLAGRGNNLLAVGRRI